MRKKTSLLRTTAMSLLALIGATVLSLPVEVYAEDFKWSIQDSSWNGVSEETWSDDYSGDQTARLQESSVALGDTVVEGGVSLDLDETIDGNLIVNDGGVATLIEGTVQGDVESDGEVVVKGSGVVGEDFVNDGYVIMEGDLFIGGRFVQNGSEGMKIKEGYVLSADEFIQNGDLSGDVYIEKGAELSSNYTLNGSGKLVNNGILGGGSSQGSFHYIAEDGVVENSGTIKGDVTIEDGGSFVIGSQDSFIEGDVTNYGSMTDVMGIVSGDISNDGVFSMAGDVSGIGIFDNASSYDLTIENGDLSADQFNQTGSGSLIVQDGSTLDANLLIGAGSQVVNIGTIKGDIQVGTEAFLQTSGSFEGDKIVNDNGFIVGALDIGKGQILISDGVLAGQFVNDGTMSVKGSVQEAYTNGVAMIVNEGEGVFETTGDLLMTSQAGSVFSNESSSYNAVRIADGSKMFVDVFSTEAGRVVNDGAVVVAGIDMGLGDNVGLLVGNGAEFVNNGTISGTVYNSGAMYSSGVIEGDLALYGGGKVLFGNDAVVVNLKTMADIGGGVNRIHLGEAADAGDVVHVVGDLSLDNSSQLDISIDANGNSDQLDVSGSVSLGGVLAVNALGSQSDYLGVDHEYLIVENDGDDSVSGSFDGVSSNFAFLTPTVKTDAGTGNDVAIILEDNNVVTENGETRTVLDLNPYAQDEEQGDFAEAMGSFDYDSDAGQEVYDAMLPLAQSDVDDAMREMAGGKLLAIKALSSKTGRRFIELMASRAGHMPEGTIGKEDKSEDMSLSYEGPVSVADGSIFDLLKEEKQLRRGPQAWGEMFGGYDELEHDNGNLGARTYGLATGLTFDSFDYSDALVAGIGLGYSRGEFSGNGADDLYSDSVHAGLYGSYGSVDAWQTGFGVKLGAGYGFHHFNTERDISIGSEKWTAKADYNGHSLGGDFEARYGFGVTQAFPLVISPMFGVQASRLWTESYDEKGAGSLNMIARSSEMDSLTGKIGVEFGSAIPVKGMILRPNASLKWVHEFADLQTVNDYKLEGASTGYSMKTPEEAEDVFELKAGIDLLASQNVSVNASGSAAWSDNAEGYSGSLRVNYQF